MNLSLIIDWIKRYFERDPVKKFYVIWGLVFLAILMIDYMVLKPIWQGLRDSKAQLAGLSRDKSRLESLNITDANREYRYKELVLDLKLTRTEYIEEKELPSIISKISTFARRQKTDLQKTLILTPVSLTGETPGRQLPVQMEAVGNYMDFAEAVRLIEDEVGPFYTWDNIQIRDIPDRDGYISVLIVMGFYERQGL